MHLFLKNNRIVENAVNPETGFQYNNHFQGLHDDPESQSQRYRNIEWVQLPEKGNENAEPQCFQRIAVKASLPLKEERPCPNDFSYSQRYA
jgi:hypothetical protein